MFRLLVLIYHQTEEVFLLNCLASIVLDQEALLPLQTQVLTTGYLSAMVVGDQTS